MPQNVIVGQPAVFDASDSYDKKERTLTFVWNFGDGSESSIITPTHIYTKAGKYNIELKLTNSDGGSVTKTSTITVKNSNEVTTGFINTTSGLLLNEIVPNPQGNDSGEWLEIYNQNNEPVSVFGWLIKINNKNYPLPAKIIEPEGWQTFTKQEVNFTLNNQGGTITLVSPQGKEESTTYPNAPEGWSWSKINNVWQWTRNLTPGEDNKLSISAASDNNLTTDFLNTPVELDDVKDFASRTKILTQGNVAVSPGVFGKDLFLAGSGLQITLQQGDWPELEVGDLISVQGTVSQTISYGTRLLVKNPADIFIAERKVNIPQATNLEMEELTQDYAGWLITLAGEITKLDTKSLTLTHRDQSIKVALKYNGSWPKIKVGDQIKVTGFLVINNNEFKLWPRSAEDIVIDQEAIGRVAGVQDVAAISKNTNSNLLGYFFIAAAILILVVGYWWEKRKAKNNGNN